MEFPSGMLGAALGTILLPSLARYHASDNHAEYSKLLDWGLRLTLLLAAPASVGLAILAVPLIATLFFHGAFSAEDVFPYPRGTARLHRRLDRADSGQGSGPGFLRPAERTGDTGRIALISLAATQAMNLAFIGWIGHAGLALSIGLAACLNAAMLVSWLAPGQHLPAATRLAGFRHQAGPRPAGHGRRVVVRNGERRQLAASRLHGTSPPTRLAGARLALPRISLHYGCSAFA